MAINTNDVTNGAIPHNLLAEVAPGKYLAPGAAFAWRGFAGELGLTVGTEPDSCYRDLAWQQHRYAIYQRDGKPLAAYPGTSNHGLGMAVDIGNYYQHPHSTLVTVGKKYGFIFDTPSEWWHVRYTGAPQYGTRQPLEVDMAPIYLYDKTTKQYALISPSELPDGYIVTKVAAEAEAYSILAQQGATAPWECATTAQFNACLALAKKLADGYRKQNLATVGNITVQPDPTVPKKLDELNKSIKAGFRI